MNLCLCTGCQARFRELGSKDEHPKPESLARHYRSVTAKRMAAAACSTNLSLGDPDILSSRQAIHIC